MYFSHICSSYFFFLFFLFCFPNGAHTEGFLNKYPKLKLAQFLLNTEVNLWSQVNNYLSTKLKEMLNHFKKLEQDVVIFRHVNNKLVESMPSTYDVLPFSFGGYIAWLKIKTLRKMHSACLGRLGS